MKTWRILGLILAVMVSFASVVGAAGLLSPAVSHLQKECRVLKTGVGMNSVSFSEEDMKAVFGESDWDGIVLTSLPALSDGVLKLGMLDVYTGQIIARDAIGALRFLPAASGKTATFGFLPYGKPYEEEFRCTIYMLDALNFAPEAEGGTLSALSSVPVYAALFAEDPDGDEVRFLTEKTPEKGELILNADGSYCYTAKADAWGEDRFSYVAVDPYGNRSEPAEVVVKVEKNGKNIVYRDLLDNKTAHSAVLLAEKDAFIGEKIGPEWYFYPEKTVTRSEFLMMAMKMNGIDPALFASDDTGFADKEGFGETENDYISAAVRLGIIYGMDTEKGRCFCPDEVITSAQASTVLGRIAALKGLAVAEAIPVAAEAEVSDEDLSLLASMGLAADADRDAEITRADAAELLYRLTLEGKQ